MPRYRTAAFSRRDPFVGRMSVKVGGLAKLRPQFDF
jgi:hypothetical protein